MSIFSSISKFPHRPCLGGALFAPACVGAGLMLGSMGALHAQTYPDHTVKIIVAQAPGSSADTVARAVATDLAQRWKVPVFIENKPGANGNIGMDAVAKAPADGYTLGLAVPSVMTVNPFVYKNMPFKPLEDLVPIAQTTSIVFALVVNPEAPIKSVADLIEYAKMRPDGINYSSAGVGNLGHLAGELFAAETGLKMTHIPNKGDTPALLDVMTGQTDMMFVPLPSAIGQIRAGKLRLLAVAAKKRSPAFPDVPTLLEEKQNVVVEGWTGIVANSKTPPAVIETIEKGVQQALADPGVKKIIENQGFETAQSGSKEFTEFVHQESNKWSKVIKRAGIDLKD